MKLPRLRNLPVRLSTEKTAANIHYGACALCTKKERLQETIDFSNISLSVSACNRERHLSASASSWTGTGAGRRRMDSQNLRGIARAMNGLPNARGGYAIAALRISPCMHSQQRTGTANLPRFPISWVFWKISPKKISCS